MCIVRVAEFEILIILKLKNIYCDLLNVVLILRFCRAVQSVAAMARFFPASLYWL